MLSWIWDNLSSLVLALVLAITVWIAAVSAEDPIREQSFPSPLPIERRGLAEGLLLVENPTQQAEVTLRGPRSILEQLQASDIELWVDLSGLTIGEHTIEVRHRIRSGLVQMVSIEPRTVSLKLESAASSRVPVEIAFLGETAVGFRANPPVIEPESGLVTGPASAVTRVIRLVAEVDLTGRQQDLSLEVELVPLDAQGERITGVEVEPERARVEVTIEPLGGYRSVVVNPKIVDQVDPGYQPTKITVSPTFVTVFSADPELTAQLGGFVETEPISLQGATDDIEIRVLLDLPQGVSVVGDPSVIVRVTIEPLESFITLASALDIQGLGSGLFAIPSPEAVNLILNGPLPTLEQLEPDDVRVVLDLGGLEEGTYQITLSAEDIILPPDVTVQTILPETIEVTITSTPPPSPTPVATDIP